MKLLQTTLVPFAPVQSSEKKCTTPVTALKLTVSTSAAGDASQFTKKECMCKEDMTVGENYFFL